MQQSSTTKILTFINANDLNAALIEDLAQVTKELISEGRNPVVALPTGNTMISFYAQICAQEAKLPLRHWLCFNLDEYYPLSDTNKHLSFQNYMQMHFYSKLQVSPLEKEILNGRSLGSSQECHRYEEKLREAGGIDVAILGLGINGHIAFNEPGSDWKLRTRSVKLHAGTLIANFKGEAPFTHALTLGIANLMEAKKIRIVALGKGKAESVKAALKGPQTEHFPASALQSHPDVIWYLDADSASLL